MRGREGMGGSSENCMGFGLLVGGFVEEGEGDEEGEERGEHTF